MSQVRDVDVELDDVPEGRAGLGVDPLEVLEGLPGLRPNVALAHDDPVRIPRDLAGDEDKVATAYLHTRRGLGRCLRDIWTIQEDSLHRCLRVVSATPGRME